MKPKTPKPKHKTVMLIDDSAVENHINEIIIKSNHFAETVYKFSGAECSLEFFKNIEMIKNVSMELLPEFIFLDINMPSLDGFQFLDEFKSYSASLKKEIKIVILTSSDHPFDIEKAGHYKQVVKFITKPLTEADLDDLG